MSERSTSNLMVDKEQISKTFGRGFIEVIENFISEDSRLNVIYTCITNLFDCMDHEGRALVLKKVLMHFLRKFPTDFDNANDQADEYIRKTLNLWRLFGKCSKTMGPVAILEKIEDSYADCWQYYQILADSLIEEDRVDTDELYKTFKKCMENCEMSNEEVRKRFGPSIMSHIKFPDSNDEDECTIQFMQVVRQNDIRKSLAARRRSNVVPSRLDILFGKTGEHSNLTKATSTEIGRLSIRDSAKSKPMTKQSVNENTKPMGNVPLSAQKAKLLQPLAPVYQTPLLQQRIKPVKVESPTATLNYDQEMQETIPTTTVYSQEMTTIQATIQTPPKDDFTVFKDPTIALKMARSINSQLPRSPTTQSPIPKRGKMNELDDVGQTAESKNGFFGKENCSFNQNSPTICGTHLSQKNTNLSFMTSTPETQCRQPSNIQFTASKNHHDTIDFEAVSPDLIDQKFSENHRRRTIKMFDKVPEHCSSKSAPSTQQKAPPPKTSLDKLNSLTRNLNQIHLLNSHSSQHETTGNGSVSLIFDGVLNPWNDMDRNIILSTSKFVSQRNNFSTQSCPQIDKSKPFTLGNKQFQPLKQIGEGGFARVFKCKYDGKIVALKYQKPACPFEVHMVDLLQSVLPKNLKPFVMSLMDAYIYKDASALIYEYLPYKTLLELSNAYRVQGTEMYGSIISLIGLQLGHVLQRIHQARIIHADLKPDNILICAQVPESATIEELVNFPLIRLIDFGRAIDMNYFNGKTFTGKAKTQCFDCVEMKDGRPWTYQTDYYGYVATIYTLMHHKYMEVKMENGHVKTKLPVKKRMITSSVWTDIFDKFLNISTCKQIPPWDPYLKLLKQELFNATQLNAPVWKNSLKILNKMVQFNCEKA